MDKQQLEFQLNYLTANIEESKRQFTETQLVLREVQETLLCLADLEAKPRSTMVSLGASTFIAADLKGSVIAPIGSNVFAAKKPGEARAVLEQRAEKIANVLSEMEKNLSQLLQLRSELINKAQQE